MKVTITVESDDPVVHITAVSKNKVTLIMNKEAGNSKFKRLSDNSIIISDAS